MVPQTNSLRQIAGVLDRLGIPYLIGGSVASGARSIARATKDIDLVANILVKHADALAAILGPEWYVEPEQIREGIRRGQSFNVVHIALGNKIDIFPACEEFHFAQLKRASKIPLPMLDDSREYPVASSEDILLAKLRWYRMGGEVSDRQWNDIGAIVDMNADLDRDYLYTWAAKLRVTDLLERALKTV